MTNTLPDRLLLLPISELSAIFLGHEGWTVCYAADQMFQYAHDCIAANTAAGAGELNPAALSWLDDVLERMNGQLQSSDAAFDWKIVRDYHADLCRVRSICSAATPPPAPEVSEAEVEEARVLQISDEECDAVLTELGRQGYLHSQYTLYSAWPRHEMRAIIRKQISAGLARAGRK